jgi:hypothetical protein
MHHQGHRGPASPLVDTLHLQTCVRKTPSLLTRCGAMKKHAIFVRDKLACHASCWSGKDRNAAGLGIIGIVLVHFNQP